MTCDMKVTLEAMQTLLNKCLKLNKYAMIFKKLGATLFPSPLYNLYNLWLCKSLNVRSKGFIWKKIITFLEFLSQDGWSDILTDNIHALKIWTPLKPSWGDFQAPYFRILNDARVASAQCSYIRTCQRVKNSIKIATIRDFQVHICVNSPVKFQILDIQNKQNRYFQTVDLCFAFFLLFSPF